MNDLRGRQVRPYWRKLKASSGSTTFNVLHYGAKGDGKSDDTKAFEQAWAAACNVEASTVIGSIRLDGKIIAPTIASLAWGSGTLQWLEFKDLNEFTITGKGVIDGQGSVWWDGHSGFPSTRPTSNTDGIHLQNSQDVVIYSSSLACGDDCVSIQTGCSNVYMHNVNCGSGHGISIGGLGKDNTKACVSNVTVRDSTFQNTLTAIRIKTWQGASGSVHDIQFSGIPVSDVETPIMIDQYYCDKRKCSNDSSSAVAVSGVHYVNLQPQSAKQSSGPDDDNGALCWKAFGELKTKTVPALDDCLQSGNPSSTINSNADHC
ncbi:hypothetical protein K1719_020925 [Acacia pycnantha]|nr:hypothetical protein K1719_020925 [Acacia pycnantha]